MTISEAVEVCKVWATVSRSRLNLLPSHHGKKEAEEITTALATLEGVRLCDESEIMKMMKAQQRMLVAYRTGGTPPQWAFDGCGAANRWLAEHGGE